MKRGKPLARKTPLKQGDKGLRAAPEKVAVWMQRSRVALSRETPLRAISPRRIVRREGYSYDEFWFSICTERTIAGDRRPVPCVQCQSLLDCDAHHVFPKQQIMSRASRLGLDASGVGELLMDTDNGIALCRRCHDLHESAHRRVALNALPSRCLRFVDRLDRRLGTEECRAYLERSYS